MECSPCWWAPFAGNSAGTCSAVYLITFPSGIEDVVRTTVHALVSSLHLSPADLTVEILSKEARKHTLSSSNSFIAAQKRTDFSQPQPSANSAKEAISSNACVSPECASTVSSLSTQGLSTAEATKSFDHQPLRPEPRSPEGAAISLRGALFLQVNAASTRIEAIFLHALGLQRCVEEVALHLFTSVCKHTVEELDPVMTELRSHIHGAVVEKLSALLRCGDAVAVVDEKRRSTPLQPMLQNNKGVFSRNSFSGLTDTSVLLRVNCTRRDKSIPCSFTSQELAAQVGGVLMDLFEPVGWRVNMLYHNVQVNVIHDQYHAHVGLLVSDVALPRCGNVMDVSSQYFMELLRRRLSCLLVQAKDESTAAARELTVIGPAMKALIPRPSSHRYELRWEKGDNAMHPGLATAITTYAALAPHMTVLDPFAGSGTILVEAWLAARCRPLHLIAGELCLKDSKRTLSNLRHTHLALLSSLHSSSLDPHSHMCDSQSARYDELLKRWMNRVSDDAAHVNLGRIAQGERSLAEGASTEAHQLLREIAEWIGQHCFNCTVNSLHADATRSPLRSGTVDRIVSDLPFGRRCGSHRTNRRVYPSLVRECYRLLRSSSSSSSTAGSYNCNDRAGEREEEVESSHVWWRSQPNTRCGGRAVLLTIEGKLMLEVLQELSTECPFVLVTEPFTVDMGGLFPYVFVLDKH